MSNVSLTKQQRAFVRNMAMGMLQTQAARAAGYKFPAVDANRLLKTPAVVDAITREQGKFEKKADMTRQKVMEGLKDAIEIARLQADANGMVAGWREIARICGYYAPEQKRIDITVTGAVQLSQIENLSDQELAALIIEGQAVHIEDDDEEDELLALPAPAEQEALDGEPT